MLAKECGVLTDRYAVADRAVVYQMCCFTLVCVDVSGFIQWFDVRFSTMCCVALPRFALLLVHVV